MINAYINRIKKSILGRDVKNSIADALAYSYETAAKAGNTDAEVQLARGSYDTLGERIDAIDDIVTPLADRLVIAERIPAELEEGKICIVLMNE